MLFLLFEYYNIVENCKKLGGGGGMAPRLASPMNEGTVVLVVIRGY